MSDFRTNAGARGRELLREMGQRVLGRYIEEGFAQAAGICLGVLEARMNELRSKAPSGKMTQADQVLWSKLDELKAEMERQIRQHAEGDWRPR